MHTYNILDIVSSFSSSLSYCTVCIIVRARQNSRSLSQCIINKNSMRSFFYSLLTFVFPLLSILTWLSFPPRLSVFDCRRIELEAWNSFTFIFRKHLLFLLFNVNLFSLSLPYVCMYVLLYMYVFHYLSFYLAFYLSLSLSVCLLSS